MTKCEVSQSFSWSPQIKVQLTHPREATLAFGSVTCFSIEYARPCEDFCWNSAVSIVGSCDDIITYI